jgi:hypothetical protein
MSTWQVGLGTVDEKLHAPGVITAQGRDNTSASPWVEWQEARHKPLGRRQCWYEDAQSLGLKAAWARQHAGLGGVALWSAEGLWNADVATRQAVWSAVVSERDWLTPADSTPTTDRQTTA